MTPPPAPGIAGPRPPLDQDWDVDLTLMVACYNEEQDIVPTLRSVLRAVDEVGCSYEVIVIDDASQDASVKLVREFQEQHPDRPIRLVANETNKGLAQNYIEGAFLGRGRYYRLVCGDDVEPVETLVRVLGSVGRADVVVPYQVECSGRPLYRRLLSRAFTIVVNGITGYRLKYYNGLAVLPRYQVMRWHTDYRGFGFQADMLTRMLDQGASYVEVPVVARERRRGESKALTLHNLLSVTHMLIDLGIRRIGRLMYGRPPQKGGGSPLRSGHP